MRRRGRYIRYPNVEGAQLPNNYVRAVAADIGRHPTTDDLVWRFRDGRMGWQGTGRPVRLPPHLLKPTR